MKIKLALTLLLATQTALWAAPYTGWINDYTGEEADTLMLWKFDGGYTANVQASAALDDSSSFNREIYATLGSNTAIGDSVLGKWGGAFQSNAPRTGTASNTNYARGVVSTNANDNTVAAFGTTALTIDFWFNPLETPQFYNHLFDKKYNLSAGAFLYFGNDGALVASVGNGTSSLNLTTSSMNWEVGTWYHLALTYDSSTGALQLFRDGFNIGVNTNPSFGDLAAGGQMWRIGNRLGSSYGSSPGIYDNFRVSSVAYDFAPIPEPSSLALGALGIGLGTLLFRRRRKGQPIS